MKYERQIIALSPEDGQDLVEGFLRSVERRGGRIVSFVFWPGRFGPDGGYEILAEYPE